MGKLKILVGLGLSALLPLVATAAIASEHDHMGISDNSSPLLEKVQKATRQFRDINAASAAGFVQATPCVAGPDFGAMGVHFVLPARVNAAVLNATEPEALIYEPQANGSFRLVGAEFIILANLWAPLHTDGSTPALDGHLFNYVAAPNRYGLPAFYELHVWAWEQNPVGSFADWNTHVSCDQQPLT